MINNLTPYPAYKDSGVVWLGVVPEHWEVPRLGAVLHERGEQNSDGRISDVLSVLRDRGVIPYSQKGNIGNKRSEDITRYKIVKPFDIVVNSMNVIIGSVGISRYTGCLSPVYYVLTRRSDSDNPQYLSAYFQTKPFQKSLVRIGNGILAHRMRIPMELLKCEPFPRPPRAEQDSIVRFLGPADRCIRRYIRAKERLIELLEEQKQAIIHQAVTGQIDVRTGQPYPAYKDSGVEWLGKVPAHWRVQRARYIFCEVNRRSRDGSEQHLSMSQHLGLVPSHCVEHRTLISQSYTGGKLCEDGDLVLNRLKAHLGVFALAHHSGVVSPDYTVLRLKGPARMDYFEQVLRSSSCRGELRIRARGIVEGFWRLYTDDFKEIRLPVPPLEEQAAIIKWIRSATFQTDRAVERASRKIDLLGEYRTRLIADVVTGKLDVREATAILDESDAPETMELANATEMQEEVTT